MAGVAGLLLPLTRAVGVFAVLPMAWAAWREAPPGWLVRLGVRARGLWHRLIRRVARRAPKPAEAEVGYPEEGSQESGGEVTTGPGAESPSRLGAGWTSGRGFRLTPWALIAAPVAGWGIYLGLMCHWTGHPWAGMEAQKYWGAHAVSNLWDVPKFVRGFFEVTAWHEFRGSLLDRAVFVLVLYTLPVLWARGRDLLPWLVMLAVIPALSGTFTSFTRFASCAFPVFVALGVFVTARRAAPETEDFRLLGCRRATLLGRLRWGLLAVFAGIHGHLLWRFLHYHWAG